MRIQLIVKPFFLKFWWILKIYLWLYTHDCFDKVVEILGDSTLVRPGFGVVQHCFVGDFWSCHFQPSDWPEFTSSSLSLAGSDKRAALVFVVSTIERLVSPVNFVKSFGMELRGHNYITQDFIMHLAFMSYGPMSSDLQIACRILYYTCPTFIHQQIKANMKN